jgi:hypothetical protein
MLCNPVDVCLFASQLTRVFPCSSLLHCPYPIHHKLLQTVSGDFCHHISIYIFSLDLHKHPAPNPPPSILTQYSKLNYAHYQPGLQKIMHRLQGVLLAKKDTVARGESYISLLLSPIPTHDNQRWSTPESLEVAGGVP